MIDGTSMSNVLRNRFELSEALDREGFHRKASEVRAEILCVMASDQFDEVTGRVHERYAMRGYVTPSDVGRSVATNAVGFGAMGGAASGGAAILPASAAGALYGLVSQPIGAGYYRWVQGPTAKAAGQAEDFASATGKLAKMVGEMGGTEQAEAIRAIGEQMKAKVDQIRTKKFDELSQQYGLKGSEAGLWERFKQNVVNPGKWLGRYWKMTRAQDGRSSMVRMADTGITNPVIDLPTMALSDRVVKPMFETGKDIAKNVVKKGFWRGMALPGAAFAAGSGITGWGLNKASVAVRGKMGVARTIADEIGRMAAEVSAVLQDPSYMQYAQQIHRILSTVDPSLAQSVGKGYETQWAKHQGGTPQPQQPQPRPQQQQYGYPYA